MLTSFSDIMPTDSHPFLVRLGRAQPWLTVRDNSSPSDPNGAVFETDWPKLARLGLAPSLRSMFDFQVKMQPGSGHIFLLWMDAFSASLCDGPKLFRPTAEQFESMQHVAVTVPLNEFRTPYPAMFIEVPAECRRQMATRAGVQLGRVPAWILVRHRGDGGLYIGAKMPKTSKLLEENPQDVTYFFLRTLSTETVEDALKARLVKHPDDELDFDIAQALVRSALNLCLLMTHYGTRPPVPLDPDAYAKHRKASKPGLHKLAAGDFLAVDMVQHIRVRGNDRVKKVYGESGRTVKPHWVTGHWRRYPGYRDVLAAGGVPKQMFISPYLVHPELIVGDVSESLAVYEGR